MNISIVLMDYRLNIENNKMGYSPVTMWFSLRSCWCCCSDVVCPWFSSSGKSKPVYVPPKDLNKYSPHHNSMQQLPEPKQTPRMEKPRRMVSRTRSVPSRPMASHKQPKRQTSSENITGIDPDQAYDQQDPPLNISFPETVSHKQTTSLKLHFAYYHHFFGKEAIFKDHQSIRLLMLQFLLQLRRQQFLPKCMT